VCKNRFDAILFLVLREPSRTCRCLSIAYIWPRCPQYPPKPHCASPPALQCWPGSSPLSWAYQNTYFLPPPEMASNSEPEVMKGRPDPTPRPTELVHGYLHQRIQKYRELAELQKQVDIYPIIWCASLGCLLIVLSLQGLGEQKSRHLFPDAAKKSRSCQP
jgi:hypothetical protein